MISAGNFAIDGPDEAAEFARDRGHGDGLELAFPGQRPVSRTEAGLRFPGDLTNGSRCGRHLLLLLLSNPRWMLIAPGALHQNAPRSAVAALGDGSALDRLARRSFGRYQAEISH